MEIINMGHSNCLVGLEIMWAHLATLGITTMERWVKGTPELHLDDNLLANLMPPPHLTLAKPNSWFLKHGLHTIDVV